MTFNRDFLHSPTGQIALVGAVLALGALAFRLQHRERRPSPLPPAKVAPSVPLPKVLTRDGERVRTPPPLPAPAHAPTRAAPTPALPAPPSMPLALVAASAEAPAAARRWIAPAGRLIPCKTVNALESNRLETPIIGVVTEDVWQDGAIIIPAGAEIHGRAALDHSRERITGQNSWRIVWRTNDADNGLELPIEGILLEREFDAAHGTWGPHDGSAGLRGQVVRDQNDRELKLFAAAFLASATTALQETHPSLGLLGDSRVADATARNAALGGTTAVLRERAQALRDAIARDGTYVRVPAGHSFYLYTTQAIGRHHPGPAQVARRNATNQP